MHGIPLGLPSNPLEGYHKGRPQKNRGWYISELHCLTLNVPRIMSSWRFDMLEISLEPLSSWWGLEPAFFKKLKPAKKLQLRQSRKRDSIIL